MPLDRIVGSIARYRNLARTFLLRTPINQDRWTRLKAARNPLESHQPVVLFKISEAYFVCDGNQRVSAARANGVSYIEAYVTEIKTAIPLTLHDFEHDEWRIKAQYVDF